MRVLVRNGVAWRLGRRAEALPLIETVDLDHRAVDFVGQSGGLSLEFLGAGHHLFDALAQPPELRCREAPFTELSECLGLRLQRCACGNADGIKNGGQRTFRYDA